MRSMGESIAAQIALGRACMKSGMYVCILPANYAFNNYVLLLQMNIALLVSALMSFSSGLLSGL